MSEQWHQHLQNLTWWEEIDRFFNPSKYSCSTFTYATFQNLFSLIIVFSVGFLVLMFLIKIYNNAEDSSTDTQQEAEEVKK